MHTYTNFISSMHHSKTWRRASPGLSKLKQAIASLDRVTHRDKDKKERKKSRGRNNVTNNYERIQANFFFVMPRAVDAALLNKKNKTNITLEAQQQLHGPPTMTRTVSTHLERGSPKKN